MSYITINVGGKERGWKVNQMTIEIWGKMINPESESASSTYGAVYAGLVANCYLKREEPDFTFEDVCNWVDELNDNNNLSDLEKIKKAFEESSVYVKVLEKLKDQIRLQITKPANKKKALKK